MNIIARKLYSFIRFYIARFSKKDPSKPFVYVAIGDSTVEGTGASHPSRSYAGLIYSVIKEKYPKAQYYNFGKYGATTRELLNFQIDKAIELQPDLVTISVGANDIKEKVRLKTFGMNVRQIIERLQKETNAKIVINNIPDFSKAPTVPKAFQRFGRLIINQYNKTIEKAASHYDVIFIDLLPHSKIYAKQFPQELISEDQFHPSDFGHALWANTIITSIADHIFPKGR